MGAWVEVDGHPVFIENAKGGYTRGKDGKIVKSDNKEAKGGTAKASRSDVGEDNVPDRVPQNMKDNREHYEEHLIKGAKARGMTVPALEAERQGIAEDLVKGASVWIRTPAAVLGKVLADGRFKTQHESGKSSGTLNKGVRKDFESRFFGTDDVSKAPVYGYLDKHADGAYKDAGDDSKHDSLGMYGPIAVKLKSDVHGRTTWTGGDSLADNGMFVHAEGKNGGNPRTLPSYLDAPSGRSLPVSVGYENVHQASLAGPGKSDSTYVTRYAEAQVHGGVSASDISEVVFYRKVDHAKYTKTLTAAGIPHRHATNPYSNEEAYAEPKKK